MGFLDEIRSYFRDDEPTLTEQAAELDRQHQGDRFGDLPEEIEKMPPEDVADTFARMEQQTRLAFVRRGYISRKKWKEMVTMIENNPKQRDFWGVDGSQIDIRDGIEVCACHDEVAQTWTETRETQETIGQTQGSSKTSKTEVSGKVSGGGGIGIPGVGNVNATKEVSAKGGRTQGETQQEMAQASNVKSTTQRFHACRVDPTYSPVSRQGFIQVGKFHIREAHNKTESDNDLIDDWEMDAGHTAEQEMSQNGSDTPSAAKNDSENSIEDIHGELGLVNEKIEHTEELLDENEQSLAENRKSLDENRDLLDQNKQAIEKNNNHLHEGEDAIERDKYLMDKRSGLQDRRDELKEEKNNIKETKESLLEKKETLQATKTDLQSRIENHEEYEETQEETDTSESATQDAEENVTEDHAAESENEETTEETTETTTGQPNDGTPEGDGGPPADDGHDDRGGEPETDTEEVEKSPTVEPGAEPAQATAEAATDETDQSESDSHDPTDPTDEPETNEEQKEYANKGELYLDRYDPANGQTGGFEKSK